MVMDQMSFPIIIPAERVRAGDYETGSVRVYVCVSVCPYAGASLEVFQWGGVGPSEYRQGHLGTDIFHMYNEMR